MQVASIHIHPVKGMRAVSLSEAQMEPWGPQGDRRWLAVDGAGQFITQRDVPAMATLVAQLTADGLRIEAPGREPIEVAVPGPQADRAEITIFSDKVSVRRADERASRWLGEVLGEHWGEACALVHMDAPSTARLAWGGESTVSFADEHPVLLTNTASLQDFNARSGLQTPMDRFRPNLVVNGAEAWVEDGWGRIAIGGVEFEVVQDCGRCVVTTIDQRTGARSEDAEPLRSLGALRRTARGKIPFGVHLRPLAAGSVRIGDQVQVLAPRPVEARPAS